MDREFSFCLALSGITVRFITPTPISLPDNFQPFQVEAPARADEVCDDLIHNVPDGGAGNGKADTLHTGGIGEGADLHGVDADDLTVAVDQYARWNKRFIMRNTYFSI